MATKKPRSRSPARAKKESPKKAERRTRIASSTRRSPSRGRSESGSKNGSAKTAVTPLLEKLCVDAIDSELSPSNTKEKIFYFLSAVQLPVLLLISRFLIQDDLFERVTYINLGGHWFGWLISEIIASNKWFDVTEDLVYLSSFIYTVNSIESPNASQLAIFFCSFVWVFRLVSFLGYRIIVRGSDWRFDALIENSAYNLFGWTSGGTWCVFNGYCLWVLAGKDRIVDGPLSSITIAGITVFFFGLLFETMSDWQKFHFADRGKKWIESGLWSFSRHPNYLGEHICWLGLAVAVIGAMKSPLNANRNQALLCLVSPVWSVFFLFFTSLMLLEKRANAKWGKERDYAEYKQRVPILLPFHL